MLVVFLFNGMNVVIFFFAIMEAIFDPHAALQLVRGHNVPLQNNFTICFSFKLQNVVCVFEIWLFSEYQPWLLLFPCVCVCLRVCVCVLVCVFSAIKFWMCHFSMRERFLGVMVRGRRWSTCQTDPLIVSVLLSCENPGVDSILMRWDFFLPSPQSSPSLSCCLNPLSATQTNLESVLMGK